MSFFSRFSYLLPALFLPIAPVHASDPSASGSDNSAGVSRTTAPSSERGGDLDVTVWYPARPGGEPILLGESVFFRGTRAMRNAPASDGKYPLILLSHGAGLAGNPQAMSWIATPLAAQGFIVAAPMHPGNSGKNKSAAETMKIWLRPHDLSETLTAIEKDPVFKDRIDPEKIGVLGLSMGGGTALALAGARVDPARLAGYCDTDALNASLCEWVRQSGVDLHKMDLRQAGRDNEDPRIRFAMAIDPAPVDIFAVESFSKISIPVAIINLGRPGTIPATAQASDVSKAISHANYAAISDASHYSMFAECKPDAASIAESENVGDPICMEGGGRSRGELHAQLIEISIAAFRRAFKTD